MKSGSGKAGVNRWFGVWDPTELWTWQAAIILWILLVLPLGFFTESHSADLQKHFIFM
jgi:hypothetical protein